MNELEKAVARALEKVYDPCSVSTGAQISIVDMGLVTGIAVDAQGRARIGVRTTSAMCTLVGSIAQAAETEALKVPGITEAVVEADARPGWTEESMTEHGRMLLESRRERSRREVPVRPREWETRAARKAG